MRQDGEPVVISMQALELCHRAELIKRIGLGQVLWLEGKHEQKRYTVAELKEIKRVYTAKLKELLK